MSTNDAADRTYNSHPSGNPSGPVMLSTGNAEIDQVLGGGLVSNSMVLVTGAPGAGKTIFAQQISFTAARTGAKVIYFTNVSEPHEKLVDHLQSFAFFDVNMLGKGVNIYNVTSQVRDGGIAETLDAVVEIVRAERAQLVVIDSFRGLKNVTDSTARDRRAIFNMGAQLAALRCTCILVGEYTENEGLTDPEFAIADTIIHLVYTHQQLQSYRFLRVVKNRGSNYLHGDHSFVISSNGLHVYPRFETLSQAPLYNAVDKRVPFGINGFDDMLYGGVVQSSNTLIVGPAGAGKTILALHFLAAGAAQGERGLMISFQENPEQLVARASQFGLGNFINLENEYVQLLSLSPVELNVDQAAWHIRRAVEQHQVRRVVIDSVAEIEFAIGIPARFDDFLAALIGYLRSKDVTSLMTREITRLFGNEFSISSHGLSYITDNIILLRYIEFHAAIRRAITVLKMRGSDHDKRLMELVIHNNTVSIGQHFHELYGLMTGMPQMPSVGEDDTGQA